MKLIITETQLRHIASVAASVVPLNEIAPSAPKDADDTIAQEIIGGVSGPGTNVGRVTNALKKIKSAEQFWKVNTYLKQRSKEDFAQLINGDFGTDESLTIVDYVNYLKGIGITATAQYEQGTRYFIDDSFKITSTPVAAAAQPATRTGWWDKFPGLMAFGKDTAQTKVIHYPNESSKDSGPVYFELASSPGTYWSFTPDMKWKQFAGFENYSKPKYTGTWKDNAGVLNIAASDGTNYTPTTGWSEKKKSNINWVKQSGNFPLKYGEFGGMIEMLQLSLGLKGDTYFGSATEKAVQKRDGSYKRETGVTEDMYYNIVGKNDVSKAATASPSQLAAPTDPGAAQTQAPAAQPAAAQPQGQVAQGSNTASTNNPY
jgi:hypothetical protein